MIRYEKWLELQHYRPRSIQTLLSLQHQVEKHLSKQGLTFNSAGIKSFVYWLSEEGYSNKYQCHLHWGIRTYCSYLHQIGTGKIAAYLPKLKQGDNRRQALSSAALKVLSSWLSNQKEGSKDYWLHQSLWSLFYGSGLRRTEALNLELSDLRISHQLLYVKTLKGGKPRHLPLSHQQVKSLVYYIEKERPIAQKGYERQLLLGRRGGRANNLLAKQLAYWRKSTGLGDELCWHVLRHSIATELVHKGMDLEQVRRFLGHKSIASTSRYLHSNPRRYAYK